MKPSIDPWIFQADVSIAQVWFQYVSARSNISLINGSISRFGYGKQIYDDSEMIRVWSLADGTREDCLRS